MKNKPILYTELSYLLGLIAMAFGAAFTELADFGMSMIVAPAYILHLRLSEIWPWFTFGVAEYCFQGALLILMILVLRRFNPSDLFAFVTAVIYGTILDLAMNAVAAIPCDTMLLRIAWFAVGSVLCSLAVSLFFHTYIAPEVYELFVKKFSARYEISISRVKTVYDCTSALLAVLLSFAFFGFGVFRGVGVGTLVCALFNGRLIGKISSVLENTFRFEDRFPLSRFFEQ